MQSTLFHQSAHLAESDMFAPDTTCPFCASTDRHAIVQLQKGPDVELLYCRTCHAASASRMPRPEALDRYYGGYYDDRPEKITVDIPSRMAAHILRYAALPMEALAGQEIFVLDYGGGDGSISVQVASLLLRQGAKSVHIALVDYNPSTAEVPDQRIIITRPGDLAHVADMSVHLVIASAVIEHIPAARDILVKLLTCLKPGGIFYARTPYVAPLCRLAAVAQTTFDFTYPAHVHDLGAKFWNHIVQVLALPDRYDVLRSTPSIVETTFGQHFLRTLAAHILKIPGYVFKETYGLVGGWEVFIRRQ